MSTLLILLIHIGAGVSLVSIDLQISCFRKEITFTIARELFSVRLNHWFISTRWKLTFWTACDKIPDLDSSSIEKDIFFLFLRKVFICMTYNRTIVWFSNSVFCVLRDRSDRIWEEINIIHVFAGEAIFTPSLCLL